MAANTEQIFNTLAQSRINAAITASATSLTLIPGGVVNFLPGWISGMEFYCTLVDASANREIIKVTDISDHIFTIERGQDSSTARAWPIGTVIIQRVIAANYERFLQKESFRETSYDPDGVVTALYDGEKLYNSWNASWWMSISGTIWKLIAGGAYVQETELTYKDVLAFETAGNNYSFSHAIGNVYAAFYRDRDSPYNGTIATFEIDSSGNISAAVLDLQALTDVTLLGTAYPTSIIRVKEEANRAIMAVAYYTSTGTATYVKLFAIADDGTITTTALGSLQLMTTSSKYVWSQLRISDTLFLVKYNNVIKSVSMAADYTLAAVDTLITGANGSLLHIYDTCYADAYQHTVATFTVAADGNISDAAIDSLTYSTSTFNPRFLYLVDDLFAVTYRDSDSDGWLKTFTISNVGVLSAVLDSKEFSTDCLVPWISLNGIIVVSLVFIQQSTSDGYVETYTIDLDGTINASPIDTIEFDTTQAIAPIVDYLGNDIIAIVYEGASGVGRCKTYQLAAP